MTKTRLLATALALGLTPATSQAAAQNFESFVIEVPFDISLPEVFNQVIIRCHVRGDDGSYFSFAKSIGLEHGKAEGSFKIGYDRTRDNADLEWLQEAYRGILQRIVRRPGFSVTAECFFETVAGPALYSPTEKDGGYVLVPAPGSLSTKLPYYLDTTGTDHGFEIVVTAADNTAPQITESGTLTTTIPNRSSSGLSALQSILEGQ